MLRNMTVMGRLGLGFSLVIVLLVLSMGMSIRQLRLLGSDVEDFAQDRVPKLALSGKVVETLLQSARQMRNVLILDAESEIASEIADVARNAELVEESLAEIGKHVTDDTERNLLKEIEEARAKYVPFERRFLDIAKKGDYSTAKDEMLGELRRAQDRYVQAVNAFIEYQAANSASEAREAQSGQDNAQLALLSLTALAVLVAALAAVLITRAILRSLGGEPAYAAEVARSIAEGDLTVTVATKAGDSASLLGSIARMRDALCASVGDIRAAAEMVGAATEEIARGNADLSTRTEQQAAALGETAASMEELTGTVKQNDENARQARMLADGACAVAAQGGDAMKEVIDAMQGISESSRRIAEIIGVIDGIAFQTNILALNAAVEAARAGEQGRGFAVVASEVRSLAHRSAEAARQVKALIGESAGRVDGGVRHVESTSRTMQQIIDSASRVSGLIAEISEASGAQLAGIEQVGKAVTQMDANTQQNAAVVEQAAAAARHMASQAEALLAAVSRFKVEVGRAAAGPAEDRSVARTETAAAVEASAPAAQEHPVGARRLALAAADDWREF